MPQWLLSIRYFVRVVGPVEMDRLNLGIKPHKYWLHSVGHWIAGVVDVVEVLAE